MKLLTRLDPTVWGEVSPPPGMDIGGGGDPVESLGVFIGWGINIFITIAGLFMLVYLLWGAFDWISSGGEKEKLGKAQNKITNALIGMILIFGVLVVFNVFAGKMLGIVKIDEATGQFQLQIPTLK
ncbi:MAG: hypothetical protein UR68_C0028G0057 [Candidatus Roizmanbacteria bacterium GW2011_GWA2_35_19]|uniref:Uncharacterized protein n=2 Tax=Candidatus Roizmaniibacteriota TaxID=1752723 RepID=A0A0G0E8T7_9BACT|nr:MAG: hypothetical protein UR63_C0050G0008 [Candidatus Roizmanbacteria bacterium GW2011_GWC2_35_12]KKP71740.1 MAG: hypothetical protein UR68_C0028G0057 [Candidatus Roizmanbacteria bacterium GW2011_GWA2_35_19]